MVESRIPISIEEAVQIIVQHSRRGETHVLPLQEVKGCYLAENLKADHSIPLFDRSMYDGYAVCAEDTGLASSQRPVRLKVTDSIPAGKEARRPLQKNEAMRIMTGAPIPSGGDAVVMLEDVTEMRQGEDSCILLTKPLTSGQHISKRGEDTQEGTILAEKGSRIGPGEMAMLATFGHAHVRVYKRPVVGIFATGTELLPINAPLEPGKIRNSNSYMLESQLEQAGAIPRYFGILEDDFERCYQAVDEALQEVDYVLTTGGAAVGDYDFVQSILKEMGADILFNKVAMRPGSVTTVAKKGEKWIFGLSGNPAACYVGFELFARPMLKNALGASDLHLPRSRAILDVDIAKPNPFTRLMRVHLYFQGSQVHATTVGLDKSGVVSALVEANGLLIVPGGEKTYRTGEELEVIWLDGEANKIIRGKRGKHDDEFCKSRG